MTLRYRRRSDCLSQSVAGEVLLVPCVEKVVDLDDLVFYLSDPVALRVWELLATPRSLDDLLAAVVEEFAVAEDRARADLERFLGELLAARVVEKS
ncbi:MAG: PqqD family protein [Planctomycetota bacterium]|nr:MAG: PqqD family protein [Planctomycetota bacterium]